jgi:surface polysaccharide O-acyltransferase-like enzyme
MSLEKLDHWIGKNLFVPPIVKLCQLTRQSQYAVSRLFWFVAALDGFYRAETLFSSVLFGVLSLVMMVTASLRADMPTRSSMWFRMFALAFLILDLITGAATGKWAGTEFWLFVLIAEYAATIRTLPPRESEKAAAAKAALGDA